MINKPRPRAPALRISIFRIGTRWACRVSNSNFHKHKGIFTSTRYVYPTLADIMAAIEEHARRLDQHER